MQWLAQSPALAVIVHAGLLPNQNRAWAVSRDGGGGRGVQANSLMSWWIQDKEHTSNVERPHPNWYLCVGRACQADWGEVTVEGQPTCVRTLASS